MAADKDMSFGFEELEKAFNKIESKYTDKTSAILQAMGRLATNKTRANSPVGKTKKLKGSWRLQGVKKFGKSLVVRIKSEAPHAHLVEYGHTIYTTGGRKGKVGSMNVIQRSVRGIKKGGRVEGKNVLETTIKSMESTFNGSVEKLFDDLTKEIQL